jgi:protein-tyrosine-phosphatase
LTVVPRAGHGRPYQVLFLCTGNSARSILAECLLCRHGAGRFRAHSAGSHPKGQVHPLALELLEREGYDTSGLRSKSWDELAVPDAPTLDFVITVCDHAASESCPVWPGQPITVHWGVEDPAVFEGSEREQRQRFRKVYEALERRVRAFTSLAFDTLDAASLKRELDAIGQAADEDAGRASHA